MAVSARCSAPNQTRFLTGAAKRTDGLGLTVLQIRVVGCGRIHYPERDIRPAVVFCRFCVV